MTFALLCVLAAGIMPILTVGFAKYGDRSFDNSAPRQWLARQDGFRARAAAAQDNGFEAFPLFAAAVIVAQMQGAPQGLTDLLAGTWIALRLGYVALYLADIPTARSAVWSIALFVAIAIFLLPAFA